MRAKVFTLKEDPQEFERVLCSWLENAGDIFLAGTQVVYPSQRTSPQFVVFFDKRKSFTPATGEPKKSAVPTSTKIPRERFPRCPECGKVMSIRARKDGSALFWGCPGFPECRNIINFNERDYLDCGWLAPEEAGGNYRQPQEESIPF